MTFVRHVSLIDGWLGGSVCSAVLSSPLMPSRALPVIYSPPDSLMPASLRASSPIRVVQYSALELPKNTVFAVSFPSVKKIRTLICWLDYHYRLQLNAQGVCCQVHC